MDRTGSEENEVITHPWVTAAIGQAQKRVELQNFQSRKKLLEYDDVMNQQREVIYALRLFALEGGEELKAEALRMVEQAVAVLADELIGDTKDAYQWDRALIETEFLLKFLVSVPGVTDPAKIRSRDELVQAAQRAAHEAFQAKLDHFKEIEAKVGAVNIGGQALSHVMLGVIDEKWKDHLYDLDQLKAAIHYRQWGQRDPLIEYKREGYEMFVGLMRDVHATFAERWLKLQIEIGPPPQRGAPSGPGGRPPASPASLAPMPLRLSEHPERDRPRERLWSVGPAALTGQELLAILLGTGCAGRDALAVAGELLARVDGSLRRLAGRPSADLARVPGVGRGKAARVVAALELGRRVGAEEEPPPERIRGPADVQRFYASRLRDLAVEEFHVLALGSQSQVLGDLLITRGILNSSLVHPREVFRAAIAEAAAGIIVVHNHPSGDPTPSADDRMVTRQLVDAGRLLDLPVYDHVIVGGDRYVSFAEAGLL